jgi:hypothetical protein
MQLKTNVLEDLKKNKACKRALEDLHEKSFYTIEEWIRKNDIMLCHHRSLKVISAYLKIEIEEMIVETEEVQQ